MFSECRVERLEAERNPSTRLIAGVEVLVLNSTRHDRQ
jgi:hypothetical protein